MFAVWLACAARQGADWSAAATSDTVAAYEAYVEAWPEATETATAARRIDDLRWEAAEAVHTVDAYRDYLRGDAGGLYRSFAQLRIEELDFVAALQTGTPDALEAFVAMHRDGRLAEQARDLLDRMHYGAAAVADTSRDYGRYLSVHPAGDYVVDARADRARTAFDEARQRASMASWLGFLNHYPSGDLADAARTEMDALRFREVALVVVLRGSARSAEQWPASADLLAQRVDFTLGNELRSQGFAVSVTNVVLIDDVATPSPPSTWHDGETGVLVMDVWEDAYSVRWSAAPSTRLTARMGLYAPDGDVAVWKDVLTATSSVVSVTDTEDVLHQSAVNNLAAALGRTQLPVQAYLRVSTARR